MSLYHFLGLDNASGPYYLFWSGFGGDLIGAIPLFGVLAVVWRRVNCHQPGCWRIGLHHHEQTVLCRKHHKELSHV